MEAKVDVRKLQVLNDRINQTIDALNQVRVSVHGLGHTSAMQPPLNPLSFLGQGYGGYQGYGPQQPYGFGSQGLFPGLGGQFGGLQGLQGGGGFGFQHSPFNPYLNPFMNPSLITPWGIGVTPLSGSPWGGIAGGIGGGLFHSNQELIDKQLAEVRASDPYRISQTFPFVIP